MLNCRANIPSKISDINPKYIKIITINLLFSSREYAKPSIAGARVNLNIIRDIGICFFIMFANGRWHE